MPPCWKGLFSARVMLAALSLLSCGEHGLFPTTVDEGADFSVADVVFDDGFYYCKVEPVLFSSRCGPGDPAQGDAANGCHSNVTSFRLTEYQPPVGDSCGGGVVPGVVGLMRSIPPVAQRNYQSAQARMKRNPELAPLLSRPTGRAQHPRTLFDASDSEAELIRQWATQYSSN